MKKRIFIGLPIPKEIKKALKKELKDIPGKVSPLDKWHITLQFLGFLEEKQLEKLYFILSTLNWGPSFNMTIGELHAFPHEKSAKVLWLGLAEGEGLHQINRLFQKLTAVLLNENYVVDARPFTPHITLSRFHPPRRIIEWIKHTSFKKYSFPVNEINLYESQVQNGPYHYHVLENYKLIL